jgi:multiple sugar transport system substrate-binding protein
MAGDRTTVTRRQALAAAGATLAGGFAGCSETTTDGGDGTTTADGQSGDSDPLVAHERFGNGGTELSYWTSTFYTPVESESDQPVSAPALRTQHEEWAENHPDYQINVEYPAFGEWKNNLLTRAAQGDAPDGSTLDSKWVADFYEFLQPLNDHVDDGAIDDFFPFVRETVMQDGDLLAAWKYTGCRCLYYRQDLMDQYNDGDPPETWEELMSVGTDITENEEMDGYMFQSSTGLANLPYFWSLGGTLVDDDGAPVLGEDGNREALVGALEFIRDLVDEGVTPQRVASIEEVEALPREGRAGNLAMFIGNQDQIVRNLKQPVEADDDIPDDRWERWRVAKIPRPADGEHTTGVGGWTDGAFVEGDGEDAAAMKEFIAKFAEPESMARYCSATGFLPTRESVYDLEEYDPDSPYLDQFREFLKDGIARPAYPIYSTIEDESVVAIENVITGESDPQSAADTMISQVNDAYDAP